MSNPKGINQFSKGKSAGTFAHGTRSTNSSGSSGRANTRADAKRSSALAARNSKKK